MASNVLESHLQTVQAGAEQARRTLPDPFHVSAITSAVVLRPGETLTSERVIDACGAWVTTALHFVYEVYTLTHNAEAVPPAFQDVWEEYCAYVDSMETPIEKRHLQIHDGHSTYIVPAERRFITPKAIQGTSLVGTPEEIIERVRQAERVGLGELTILPATETNRDMLQEFADTVMRRN